MPVEFDPDWEYWVGDPEITDLLDEADDADPMARLWDYRLVEHESLGLRFGRGNPDFFRGRLARPKRQSDRPDIPRINCKACRMGFQPTHRTKKYCSRKCRFVGYDGGWATRRENGTGPPAKGTATCPQCRSEFDRIKWDQKCCSRQCDGLLKRQRTVVKTGGCRYCGEPVSPSRTGAGPKKVFCSRRCQKRHKSREYMRRRRASV